jgi:hypothetical protein
MKNLKYFTMAGVLASMALVSCSSDTPDQGLSATSDQEKGETFLSMHINLPTSDVTRSVDDTDAYYDDGLESEYAISSANLYIYRGSATDTSITEDDYECVETSTLTVDPQADTDEGITTTSNVVARLALKPDSNYKYYALVLVNTNTRQSLPTVGSTYGDWKYSLWGTGSNKGVSLMADNSSSTLKKFYMANALRNVNGVFQTLVEIPNDQFCSSVADAESSTGVKVFVERGLAKVTIDDETASGVNSYWQTGVDFKGADWSKAREISSTSDNYSGGKIIFVGWAVSNTNATTYPIHVLQGSKTGTGNDAITGDALESIRTNSWFKGNNNRVAWAYTPRYYDHANGGYPSKQLLENGSAPTMDATVSDVRYMLENCQDYADMYKSITSRVIFKAIYKPAGGAHDEDGTFYMLNSKARSTEDMLEYIVGHRQTAGVSAELARADIDLSKIEDGKLTTACFAKTVTAEEVASLNATLGITDKSGIKKYDKGYCYYATYIRHFSDNVSGITWKGGDYVLGNLGRYGTVRNNWYSIYIQDVILPGSPDVPPIPGPGDPDNPNPGDDEQDDVMDSFFKVKINVLAWAVRTQQLVL